MTSFTIEVFTLPIINSTVTLKQCDNNIDGFSAFNLQEAKILLVNNITGLSFSFFETFVEAQNNTNSISNSINYINQTVNSDTVFVRIENSNGCFRIAQINLVVSTTLIPQSFQIVKTECDDLISGSNTDGISTFDFSDATSQIQSLFPTGQLLTITYYKNEVDALAETNAILNSATYTNTGYPNLQNIYVRVDSQLNNECLGLGHHITLKVERIPIIQSQIIHHCDDNQDGIYAFDTTNLQSNLLNGMNNVVVTYSDQNGTALQSPFPNSFSTTSQTITVSIKNNYGKQCSYLTTIQFIVDDLPQVFSIPTNLTSKCDDEINPIDQDGSLSFDTSSFESFIFGSQTGMNVAYYDENNNLFQGGLPNPLVTFSQNITVKVTNLLNSTCDATGIIPLVVNEVPKISLTGNELICSDNPNFTKTINAGLLDSTTNNNFTYKWFKNNVLLVNETNYTLIVNAEGSYTVAVTNVLGCIQTRTIIVTASNSATIENIIVTDLDSTNSITIIVSGFGNYVYSLDNINFQDTATFTNILPGIYTVYVKDLNDCGIIEKEVSVLGIPIFFTPNNDGVNDYWNIKGINQKFNGKTNVLIFDRYGKLLKQLSPLSQGWDGKYNNKLLSSDDYWYSIQLEDGRISKGHFALKR